jgi:hypothetical protein
LLEKENYETNLVNKLILKKILTRQMILNALIQHGTLSLQELADPDKLGMKPDIGQLSFLLSELKKAGDVAIFNPMTPYIYSIAQRP